MAEGPGSQGPGPGEFEDELGVQAPIGFFDLASLAADGDADSFGTTAESFAEPPGSLGPPTQTVSVPLGLSGLAEAVFDSLEKDQDGNISPTEWRRAVEALLLQQQQQPSGSSGLPVSEGSVVTDSNEVDQEVPVWNGVEEEAASQAEAIGHGSTLWALDPVPELPETPSPSEGTPARETPLRRALYAPLSGEAAAPYAPLSGAGEAAPASPAPAPRAVRPSPPQTPGWPGEQSPGARSGERFP